MLSMLSDDEGDTERTAVCRKRKQKHAHARRSPAVPALSEAGSDRSEGEEAEKEVTSARPTPSYGFRRLVARFASAVCTLVLWLAWAALAIIVAVAFSSHDESGRPSAVGQLSIGGAAGNATAGPAPCPGGDIDCLIGMVARYAGLAGEP